VGGGIAPPLIVTRLFLLLAAEGQAGPVGGLVFASVEESGYSWGPDLEFASVLAKALILG
jgi:hypothetical protein